MKKTLTAAIILTFCTAARAYTDAGGRYTAGPDGYAGVNAFAEWGNDDGYLRPSANTYKSDLSDRVSSYSLGGGLDRGRWSAGGELSFTPETNGYRNYSAYADLSYTLTGEPRDGAALQTAGVGIFGGYTAHEDSYSASTSTVSGGGRRSKVSSLTSSFKLGQADYGVSAWLKVYGLRASCRYTMTSYTKDVTAEVRQLPVEIGGIGTSGFPDTAISARLSVPGLPVAPEAGYTLTSYLLDQPDSESLTLGLTVKAGPAELYAGWEGFNPGDGSGLSNYYSAGLTWSFGD